MQLGIPYEILSPDGTRAVVGNCDEARQDPDYVGFLDPEAGITGLQEAEVREDAEERSDADGGVHGDFLRGRMPIVIQGSLDPSADIATLNLLEDKIKRATRALRGDGTLSWTPTGSVRRMVTFRMQQPTRVVGRLPKRFQASLVCASHRVLSSDENSVTFAAGGTGGEIGFSSPISDPLRSAISDTGAAQVANIGSEESPPRFRIDGPITNPTIRNATTGQELRLLTSLTAGNFITIDVENAEVLLNGVADAYAVVQFPESAWWNLQPGSNDVRLLAASFSAPAALTVFWRHAWS